MIIGEYKFHLFPTSNKPNKYSTIMISQAKEDNGQPIAGGEVEQVTISAVTVNKAGKDPRYMVHRPGSGDE